MQAIDRQPRWPPDGATVHYKRHRPELTTLYRLGVSFFVLFVAVWAAATFGGLVSKNFLADPLTFVKGGYTLPATMGFGWDIGWTVWRVLGGFVLAAALGLPLGVLMGAYKPVRAFLNPPSTSRATCQRRPSLRC